MTTQLSSRGNVSLPSVIRKHMRLKAGTTFRVHTVGGYIVLMPKPRNRRMAKSDHKAPKITSEMVKMLSGDYC